MSEIKNIRSRRKCPVSLLWISLLLVGFASSIFAAKDYSIETIPNVRLSNRLNHVSNPDGIITPDDAARINQLLNVVEDSLGIEVAVVAVNSIGDQDARMFATDLFKHWGLGQKSKDNGLLIQLVTEPSQRSVVFETGYGIEGVLPDAICYRLQQRYMMPDLKAGDYSAGMLKGVMAVTKYLMSSDYERAGMTGNRSSSSSDDDFMWIFVVGIIGMIGFSAFIAYLKYRPKACPRCGKKTFVYMGQQVIREATRFRKVWPKMYIAVRVAGIQRKKIVPSTAYTEEEVAPVYGWRWWLEVLAEAAVAALGEVEAPGWRFDQSFLKIRLFALFYTSGHVKPYVTACVFVSYCSFR